MAATPEQKLTALRRALAAVEQPLQAAFGFIEAGQLFLRTDRLPLDAAEKGTAAITGWAEIRQGILAAAEKLPQEDLARWDPKPEEGPPEP
jgi:hypothetical protein